MGQRYTLKLDVKNYQSSKGYLPVLKMTPLHAWIRCRPPVASPGSFWWIPWIPKHRSREIPQSKTSSEDLRKGQLSCQNPVGKIPLSCSNLAWNLLLQHVALSLACWGPEHRRFGVCDDQLGVSRASNPLTFPVCIVTWLKTFL